jgi:hypothetical protein
MPFFTKWGLQHFVSDRNEWVHCQIGRSFVSYPDCVIAFHLLRRYYPFSFRDMVSNAAATIAMMLGFKSLPKKKQGRESPSAGRSPGRSGDDLRELPATERQKNIARAPGITSPTSTSMENSPDLIAEERASER